MGKRTRDYLALDLGAESGRAIVGRFDGRRLRLTEVYRFTHDSLRFNGTLRWHVLGMAAHLRLALAAAAAASRGNLRSLGVDSWGVDYVLLDRNDDLLGYPWQYRDARTDPALPAVFRQIPPLELFRLTGIQPLWFNTLFQLYAEVMQRTGAIEAARTLLFIPDFLTWTLGGEKACEYTIASTSQMLDARRRNWARGLLRRLNLPTALLPPLVAPGALSGRIRPEVARETGAPRSLRIVAVGRHDTASAVAAVPAADAGDWAFLSSGTWSLVGTEESRPALTEQALAGNLTNEGGLGGAYLLLANIMGLWLVQELRRAWTDRRGRAPDYAELTAAAAAAPSGGPRVDPDWPPFGRPDAMPEKIVRYCRKTRQTPPRTQGEFVRCALDSLAAAYRRALDNLEAVRGRPIRRLHIVGGGSRNELLNQLAADATGREVLAGPVEATAIGNILAQLLADREIHSIAEGRAIVQASFRPKRFLPRPH